jgi:hypothetical protein
MFLIYSSQKIAKPTIENDENSLKIQRKQIKNNKFFNQNSIIMETKVLGKNIKKGSLKERKHSTET